MTIKKYKLPKIGSKMPYILHFSLVLMNTSNQVQTNHLEVFYMFAKMIRPSEFQVSGSRCEDLKLMFLSPNVK